MGQARRIMVAFLLVIGAVAGSALADPAPVDGLLFPIDSVIATGTSPGAFTVSFRDLTAVPTAFQVQYAFDANAPDGDWTDAAPLLPARKLGTNAGGYRTVPVTIPSLAQASQTPVYFRVRAAVTYGSAAGDPGDGLVNGPWAGPDGAILGPLAPSGVSVVISNSNLPLVKWTNNATGDPLWAGTFIYRAEGTNPQKVYATLPTTETEFFDAAVQPGKKYTYIVVSYRQTSVQAHLEQSTSVGTPAPVSIVTPNTPPPNVPIAPIALGAIANGSSSITLTWTDNAVNEDGFIVERSLDNGTSFSIRATMNVPNTIAYVDTHLNPGGTYTYRVRAFNAGGQSAPSNLASATTPSLPPPIWVSPDASKQNQVQPYSCAIWGTANYNAGVRDVFVLVVDNVSGATTGLPFATVNPSTNEWRIDWHTYEFKSGKYHLKAYSHANVSGTDYYSGPANVIGWTVPGESIPCAVTDP